MYQQRAPLLQQMLDDLATRMGNKTQQEAIEANSCSSCNRSITVEEFHQWPLIDQREYFITGYCDKCQAKVFDYFEEDEDDD